ncbi:MAG TPA: DinB family protein [Nocardioidaceae bacterium]|nr:DinB family protein [Nocardioidaceae bacterium]
MGGTGCARASRGGPAAHYETWEYAGTAAEALGQLDAQYGAWITGVRSLDGAGLSRPCGPAEGGWAAAPMATLVMHINRELIHHGAEVCLLRDLYRQHDR